MYARASSLSDLTACLGVYHWEVDSPASRVSA
jgi:hypothetical protein